MVDVIRRILRALVEPEPSDNLSARDLADGVRPLIHDQMTPAEVVAVVFDGPRRSIPTDRPYYRDCFTGEGAHVCNLPDCTFHGDHR